MEGAATVQVYNSSLFLLVMKVATFEVRNLRAEILDFHLSLFLADSTGCGSQDARRSMLWY